MPKLITIRTHEPIGVSKHFRQPWSDVYISFTGKPGRKIYKFAPTLVSRSTLERDIIFERELQQKHPDEDYSATIKVLEEVRDFFNDGGQVYTDTELSENTMPTIYTKHEHIDRAEAERMLIPFLKTLGFSAIRYKWVRPKFIVHPAEIMGDAQRAPSAAAHTT